MRTQILAATLLIGSPAYALAADATVDEVIVVDSAYDWSGVYVGGAVGFSRLDAADTSYGDGSVDDDAISVAAYAGYNFQHGNWVFGAEGDIKWADTEISDGEYMRPLQPELAASIRGRLGYAAGQFLPYLTGGLAVGSFEVDHGSDGLASASETVTGYVVGGGVEWAATQNLIVRAEYLFTDYGTNDFKFSGSDIHDIEISSHDVRIGVAYKF